jgi:hypothetical protein
MYLPFFFVIVITNEVAIAHNQSFTKVLVYFYELMQKYNQS